MEIPKYETVLSRKSTRGWLHQNYPEFYSYLLQESKYADCKYWGERVYRFYNHIDKHPKCPICGKLVSYLDPKLGYRKYCSPKCASLDPAHTEAIKKSNLEKYGVDNPFKSKDIQQKIKKICFEKYGYENPQQCPEIKKRAEATNLKKYGVKNVGTLRTKDVVSYEMIDNQYVYQCPHPDCNQCIEKTYLSTRDTHNNRRETGSELCTKLMPSQPFRSVGTSLELQVREWLNEYHIEYINNTKQVISPLELDIYIPSKRLAVECNGIYWHSTRKVDKNKHFEKLEKCREQGIQLLTLWEDQIQNSKQQLKNILLSKLGIYETKIGARECIIKEVSSRGSTEFLNKYHLQGSINSSIRLGLFKDNELLALMTLGRGRKSLNEKVEWELYRYCCKGGMCIIGGFSKLLKHFIQAYHPKSIITFSANDISEGNVYIKNGFKKIKETIGYWYIDKKNLVRYHRYSFTKQSLVKRGFDCNKSESEIMKKIGFYKIYDSGQSKWILESNDYIS